MNVKHYATSKFFARPPPPFGLRPSGGGGRYHMYLNPDNSPKPQHSNGDCAVFKSLDLKRYQTLVDLLGKQSLEIGDFAKAHG